MSGYDPQVIEAKWQALWAERGTFRTANPGDPGFDTSKPKYYVLDMFPYPSGVGLHVGHPLGYIATDIVARYKRMRGFNVLHPMGFDAFGLPAEQFAVEHGVHPAATTQKNIDNMVRQLKRLGLSYDWDRCLSTTDPDYYRWTQWIFLKLYKSWFDPSVQAARPIAELEKRLAVGDLWIDAHGELVAPEASGIGSVTGDPIGARKWSELEADEREAVLDDQRLAFLAEVPVNWCPQLGTVLANEEVTNDGRSERGNYPVFKRPLKQWMLRITVYADRLASELDDVNWPEAIKKMQRDWVGRSEGALVDFAVAGSDESIRVYTTRPDTLFGATYMVLAPEHVLVLELTTEAQRKSVEAYVKQTQARSDVDRMADAKTKSGVFTGAHAINPVNGAKIPIWIADYVLMGYGTGAIMAVPAHDERDHAFAKAFDLPVIEVVKPPADWSGEGCFAGAGTAMNSAHADIALDDLPTDQAKLRITQWLAAKGCGHAKVQYKLRDWLFSRQRYWGEPFPILHTPGGGTRAVDESELPVALPEMEDFSPSASEDPDAPPRPPLGRADESWRVVERDGVRCERELNTMPQWAGSCWYYLRFLDNRNTDRFVSREAERYWMGDYGIDLYVGGAEHAVLHLLYARFWHKVLFDLGEVGTREPFGRLFNQGYIQAYCFRDARGIAVPAAEIVEKDGKYFYNDEEVTREYGKMGKGLKNAVSPDEMCEQYGCDALRLYEMYLGPLDASKPWSTKDIVGLERFLQRLWRHLVNEDGSPRVTDAAPDDALLRLTHKTIDRVTVDMERLGFNTAIAGLIELNNAMTRLDAIPRAVADPLVRMLAPLAPHMAEELWEKLGHQASIAAEPWPQADPKLLIDDEIEIVVQILGKVRGRIVIAADADQKTVEAAALAEPKIVELLEGKTVRKVIVVPKKLVNIVAN